ncbi:peptidase [Rugosibacter aromaticivorans]|uniref:Peptidase n=1 Tax=Rugosibacter aromaticivorans TaxID=1565605 RepID=A0A0C5JMY8_9PROT|nr:XRE family transcriptional regulator [Rugosibacter aromaticivorans]AJP48741.1 peptidase [Rugosibacter aromaticivorans]TBR14022.1 MAG: ImmA/IrrE family metallo-endopeptidase [Rugosibacter sp.]
MERIQSINPERISWCCADRGITLEDFASEVGIAAANINKVMAGEAGITFNQLRKIAEYFGRGVLFFLEPGPVDEAQVHTPQFRTLANQKPELSPRFKALIERVEKQRAVYLSLREELDDADTPRFSPPDLAGLSSQTAAGAVRQWLGLAERNDFESYRRALEAKGLLVFRSNGYNGKWQIAKESPILGFSLYDPECPVIVIKKQAWEPQQSFTLMHELGHLLLHKTSSIDDNHDLHSHEGREQEANAFAGHLLVPQAFLTNIRDADRPHEVDQFDEWLREQRKAWGVSGEVILRRLLDVGRLPRNQYAAYREWRQEAVVAEDGGGSRAYRHREPTHVFGDTFVRTVLDALSARHITLTKASSYLDNLTIKDLHSLERHYAGV